MDKIFPFLVFCSAFDPKEWEKVVSKVKFLAWEESAFLGQSSAHGLVNSTFHALVRVVKD